MRIILLNAFPLNAFDIDIFTAIFEKTTVHEIKNTINIYSNFEIKNYIRHKGTVDLLKKVLGVEIQLSSDLYKFDRKDIIFIITLKTPVRGQEIEHVKEDDLSIYKVSVVPGNHSH